MENMAKARIRAAARAARRERREREAASRIGARNGIREPLSESASTGARALASTPSPALPVGPGAFRPLAPEAPALLESWRSLLSALGLRAAPLLPALFLPVRAEPDIRPIIAAAPRALLPALVDARGERLRAPGWAESGPLALEAIPGPRDAPGDPEGPEALSRANVVLLPALAIDEAGTRVGQGGGWYDRALTRARPGVPVVAAIFDEEFSAAPLPSLPHDRRVDAFISPGGFGILPH